MMDVFGNYVVQKLFEVCDQAQKVDIAGKMEGNVFKLSMEMYGCRVGFSFPLSMFLPSPSVPSPFSLLLSCSPLQGLFAGDRGGATRK